MDNYLLLAPGPVNLHPRVREILSEPMIHHRTPAFDEILARVLARLPRVFGTKQRVYLLTSTGSGGMECLMVNSCAPHDEILVINSGKFGERWVEMGKAFGLQVHEFKVPWGQTFNPEELRPLLESRPIRAVFCQACETSTGVRHPIDRLGALIRTLIRSQPQPLLLVDGITAVGAYPVPMDEWGIDGLVAGSQKAFMLPTGLSFVSFSDKAWQRINSQESSLPRFYFDIREEDRANRRGETWFSSNVSLIKALDAVLEMIWEKGLDTHYAEIRRRAEFTRATLQQMGFSLYAAVPADSLTAFLIPDGFDSQKLRTTLERDFQITLMGGQDALKGKILRIGHMGYIQDQDLIRLMQSLQKLFQQVNLPYHPLSDNEMISWLSKH